MFTRTNKCLKKCITYTRANYYCTSRLHQNLSSIRRPIIQFLSPTSGPTILPRMAWWASPIGRVRSGVDKMLNRNRWARREIWWRMWRPPIDPVIRPPVTMRARRHRMSLLGSSSSGLRQMVMCTTAFRRAMRGSGKSRHISWRTFVERFQRGTIHILLRGWIRRERVVIPVTALVKFMRRFI